MSRYINSLIRRSLEVKAHVLSLQSLCFHSDPETVAQPPRFRLMDCRLIKMTNMNYWPDGDVKALRPGDWSHSQRSSLSSLRRDFSPTVIRRRFALTCQPPGRCKYLKAEQQPAGCVTREVGVLRIDPHLIEAILKTFSSSYRHWAAPRSPDIVFQIARFSSV